jgi:hypothetical protein
VHVALIIVGSGIAARRISGLVELVDLADLPPSRRAAGASEHAGSLVVALALRVGGEVRAGVASLALVPTPSGASWAAPRRPRPADGPPSSTGACVP